MISSVVLLSAARTGGSMRPDNTRLPRLRGSCVGCPQPQTQPSLHFFARRGPAAHFPPQLCTLTAVRRAAGDNGRAADALDRSAEGGDGGATPEDRRDLPRARPAGQ